MINWQNLPISRKLTYLLAINASIAALLISALLGIYGGITAYRELTHQLQGLARVSGENSRAALAFGDNGSARSTLAALQAIDSVVESRLFDRDQRLFARHGYERSTRHDLIAALIRQLPLPQQITISEQLIDDGGRIEIDATLGGIWQQLAEQMLIALALIVIAVVLAVASGRYFGRHIVAPLTNLARISHQISLTRDYRQRASKSSHDEIGMLVDDFNLMLQEVESRDQALQAEQALLEQRVRERTGELQQAKEALEHHMQLLADSRNRLLLGQEILAEIIRSPVFAEESQEQVMQLLTERIAHALGVGRVGIWQYCPSEQSLTCVDLWDGTHHSRGMQLLARDYPGYFSAIMTGEPILAEDAHQHPATREFSATYLTSHGIQSMLDLPIHVRSDCWGVICCEQQATPRHWSSEHMAFATAASTLAAQAVEAAERRAATHALLQAKEEAERANAAKTEFLSRMSHELRTPLNAIIGFAQLLSAGTDAEALTPGQREDVDEIEVAGRHLLEQVNEILDLSRIESGQIELNLEEQAVQPLLEAIYLQLRPLSEKRGLHWTLDLPPEVNVLADSFRLRQIISNFLSNAIKYNRENGSIRVYAEAHEGFWRISFADSGKGIPAAAVARLFNPFERLESAYDGIEGSGIGLALVKKLTMAMGGEVGVSSEPGVGSTFWFTLPMATVDAENDENPATSAPSDEPAWADARQAFHVLYIEDNLANQKLVSRVFKQQPGISVEMADHAAAGLAAIDRQVPDLLLLDLNLPDRDGLSVMLELRSRDATRKLPMIAISANAMQRDIDKAIAAGFDAYLTKPFDLDQFKQIVARFGPAPVSD